MPGFNNYGIAIYGQILDTGSWRLVKKDYSTEAKINETILIANPGLILITKKISRMHVDIKDSEGEKGYTIDLETTLNKVNIN